MGGNEYPEAPRVGVGAVVVTDGKVLLVRRGNPPSQDQWAIPGGRIELGETLQDAAAREVLEETGITIRVGEPVDLFDVIRKDQHGRVQFHYVIVDFMAEYVGGSLSPADDALDARWIGAEEAGDYPINETTLALLRKLGFMEG